MNSVEIAILDDELRLKEKDTGNLREIHRTAAALLYSRAQAFDNVVHFLTDGQDISVIRNELLKELRHEQDVLIYLEGKED